MSDLPANRTQSVTLLWSVKSFIVSGKSLQAACVFRMSLVKFNLNQYECVWKYFIRIIYLQLNAINGTRSALFINVFFFVHKSWVCVCVFVCFAVCVVFLSLCEWMVYIKIVCLFWMKGVLAQTFLQLTVTRPFFMYYLIFFLYCWFWIIYIWQNSRI